MVDSPEDREEALAGAPEIPPSQVLTYMGTDIYLQCTPTAPRNLPEVRTAICKQLPLAALPGRGHDGAHGEAPEQATPPGQCLPPYAQVHAANDALMVKGYKHMTGTSRHAHTDTLLGPWKHGYQGLTRSSR